MVPKAAYPPTHHHPSLTQPLSPSAAQAKLATFLAKTQTQPYLHPDALLSTSGITYSAQSGPTGGLTIHHLKRIDAGLQGENLVAETADELAQFGGEPVLPEGDDSKLDAAIESQDGEKKKGAMKRKRSVEEVGRWAQESSEAVQEGWQDPEEFEQSQRALEGEIGEREGAPATSQGGAPPAVLPVEGGEGSGKAVTEADKRAKRDAKKAKKKGEKAERGQKRKEAGETGG